MWVTLVIIGGFLGYRLAVQQGTHTATPSQTLTGTATSNNYQSDVPRGVTQAQVPAALSVNSDHTFMAPVAIDVTAQVIAQGLFA